MLTLALESSAGPASAAVLEDGRLLGESFINTKQTHSQTLMPMVDSLLKSLDRTPKDFDLFAVSSGPGSFTGIRIGVSCLKGLAMANETPCYGVSTLETIAYGGSSLEGRLICAVMDARCGQVYQALFRIEQGIPVRVCEDRALSIAELSGEYSSYGDSLVLFGDGAELCYRSFREWGAVLAPETIRYQRASSVGLAAEKQAGPGTGGLLTPGELMPTYLRLPQAERELKKRTAKEGER